MKKFLISNLFIISMITLTWPDIYEGFFTGLSVALNASLIYLICAVFIFPKGVAGIYKFLIFLHVPEKLRILILLALRGIFIFKERFEKALISLKLRAPDVKNFAKIKYFAYITGSILLQAEAHSEKMERAVKCRGGFKGFNAVSREKIEKHENFIKSPKSFLQIS